MEGSVEPSFSTIDATVGGLVWVRRRNGSWWPGRIIGADELANAGLVSPKQGTPIKLLGKEDASVDWFNLEKSKRVKAFRCGEYDEFIERAKAAGANFSKKSVKYARREDAILHALELEKAHQVQEPPSHSSQTDKSGVNKCSVKVSPVISHSSEENEKMDDESSSFNGNSNLPLVVSQSAIAVEEQSQFCISVDLSVNGGLRQTLNDSDDDGMERVKRMRGLNDLGVSRESSPKRNGSQIGHVPEVSKRKDRRRSLSKVLESTALVTVPVMFEQLPCPRGSSLPGLSDSKVSGLGSDESRRSLSVVLNNSDSTGVSCNNGMSFNASAHNSDVFLMNGEQKDNDVTSMSGLPKDESFDELYDVPLVDEENNPSVLGSVFASCSSQKHPIGSGAQSSQSSQIETLSLGNEELHESGSTSSAAVDIDSIIDQNIEYASSKWQLKGKRKRANNRYRRQDCMISEDVDDDESDDYSVGLENPPKRKKTCFTMNQKYPATAYTLANRDFDFCLFDVNLEVNTGYRPQHVPYISLMSKVHGRPIIGHPLTIEVLDDGLSDLLVIGSRTCFPSSSCDEDGSVLGDSDVDYEVKPSLGGRTGPAKHQMDRHVSRSKAPKNRKNGLSRKMKRLSSLADSRMGGEEGNKSAVGKFRGPAIACVPLNLVFSRMNASFNSSSRSLSRGNR